MRTHIKKVVILPGDGIGQEVVPIAVRALEIIIREKELPIELQWGEVGEIAYQHTGQYFPELSKKICDTADAILFGAVTNKPLLELRKRYGLFANIRPVVGNKVDLVIFRELTGGIYFGKCGTKTVRGVKKGYHTMEYSLQEIKRIARLSFQYATEHNKKLSSLDKDNALPFLKWRKTVTQVAREFPKVKYQHMYIDNALAQVYRDPKQFQVVLCSNLFGDLFSDLAAEISGGLSTAASISLNDKGFILCEPVHGTAPDIVGKNIADPTGALRSVQLMLSYFGYKNEGQILEKAISITLRQIDKKIQKFLTKDYENKLVSNIKKII